MENHHQGSFDCYQLTVPLVQLTQVTCLSVKSPLMVDDVDFRPGFAIIKLFLLTSISQGNNAQMYVIAKSILCEILQVVVNEEGRKQPPL